MMKVNKIYGFCGSIDFELNKERVCKRTHKNIRLIRFVEVKQQPKKNPHSISK